MKLSFHTPLQTLLPKYPPPRFLTDELLPTKNQKLSQKNSTKTENKKTLKQERNKALPVNSPQLYFQEKLGFFFTSYIPMEPLCISITSVATSFCDS